VAREVRVFQVTIPAGTAIATPFRQSITFPVRQVDTLEIIVPPGPSGQMGFAVTMGGVNVLPTVPGTWVITDDETIRWPLDGLPSSGAWQVSGYNLGAFDHTVYMRWLVDVATTASGLSVVAGASLADLSSSLPALGG
jgi:hypothetical protein